MIGDNNTVAVNFAFARIVPLMDKLFEGSDKDSKEELEKAGVLIRSVAVYLMLSGVFNRKNFKHNFEDVMASIDLMTMSYVDSVLNNASDEDMENTLNSCAIAAASYGAIGKEIKTGEKEHNLRLTEKDRDVAVRRIACGSIADMLSDGISTYASSQGESEFRTKAVKTKTKSLISRIGADVVSKFKDPGAVLAMVSAMKRIKSNEVGRIVFESVSQACNDFRASTDLDKYMSELLNMLPIAMTHSAKEAALIEFRYTIDKLIRKAFLTKLSNGLAIGRRVTPALVDNIITRLDTGAKVNEINIDDILNMGLADKERTMQVIINSKGVFTTLTSLARRDIYDSIMGLKDEFDYEDPGEINSLVLGSGISERATERPHDNFPSGEEEETDDDSPDLGDLPAFLKLRGTRIN